MLRSLFRFASAKKGNVALIFAFSVIPFLLLAGFAIDIGRAILVRERLGHAIDAAILAVGASPQLTNEQAQEFGEEFFQANFGYPLGSVAHDIDVNVTGDVVTISARADVPTTLLALLNHESIGLYQEAEATRGGQDLELVMVLDNTYSMMIPSSKIADLRTAAHEATEIIFRAAGSDPDSVKIGLVPFAGTVNVGSAYAGAAWLDPTAQSPVHSNTHTWNARINRWTLFNEVGIPWAGCVEARPETTDPSAGMSIGYDMSDAPPNAANPSTLFVPYFHPDVPGDRNSAVSGFTNAHSWLADHEYTRAAQASVSVSGLSALLQSLRNAGLPNTAPYNLLGQFGVGDKYSTLNAARQAYVGKYYFQNPSAGALGPNTDCISDSVVPMTTDEDTLLDEIDDMQALSSYGYTNIPNGIAWGVRVLSENSPFTEGRAWDTEELVKAMIILTDGENFNPTPIQNNYNGSTYTAYGFIGEGRLGTPTTDANTLRNRLDFKTEQVCDYAKSLGARVYTITLMVGDDDTEEMMEDCASVNEDGDPLYWDSPSSDQLESIFYEIARDLVDLRLSR